MPSFYSLLKSLINKRKQQIGLSVVLIILISACSVEGKIAKQKLANTKFRAMIIGPEFIHKLSLKSDSLTKADSLRIGNIDSLLYFESDIVQYIDDSIFINLCLNNMMKELISSYNVTLYKPDSPYELLPDSTFVLNFAEMEMEEFRYKENYEYFDDFGSPHYFDIDVTAINLNTWFELEYKTPSNDLFPVLYSSFFHYDDEELVINTLLGRSDRSNDTINKAVISAYRSAADYGKIYASYFYDYMLNVKINDLIPEGKRQNFYMHYDYLPHS